MDLIHISVWVIPSVGLSDFGFSVVNGGKDSSIWCVVLVVHVPVSLILHISVGT